MAVPTGAPSLLLLRLLLLPQLRTAAETLPRTPVPPRALPAGPLLLAYADRGCTDDGAEVLAEARAGVNVVVWFAVNLGATADGATPRVEYGINSTCVALVAKTLRDEGLKTAHLISIGGWDAPHPNTNWNGSAWWDAWRTWNAGDGVSRPALGWYGFDGFDWDLEGNDTPSSPWNHFTVACMDLVGEMSQAAKRAGYVVTMVPPESYLDPTEQRFDLSLRHAYDDGWQPDFLYHGRNCYAYLLAKFGEETFDLIDVQLYESWAHADFAIVHQGSDPAKYLLEWATAIVAGWEIDFAPLLPKQTVRVNASRLVVGFSFGFAGSKSVFIWPEAAGTAFAQLETLGIQPRGCMFWNAHLDQQGVINGTFHKPPGFFATEFNKFLNIRQEE